MSRNAVRMKICCTFLPLIIEVHSKNFWLNSVRIPNIRAHFVACPNVLLMLKTFEVHSKWRNIERHSKYILSELWLYSKYSYGIPITFEPFWSWSRENRHGKPLGRFLDGHMLAIQSSHSMRNISHVSENLLNRCPFFRSGGTCDNLILVFLHNGMADFRNDDTDGVPCYTEAVHEAGLLVTCCQEPHCIKPASSLQVAPSSCWYPDVWWVGHLDCRLMASCVRNIYTKNY